MEIRGGKNSSDSRESGRYQNYESARYRPADIEQRGVRFPESWHPDEHRITKPSSELHHIESHQPEIQDIKLDSSKKRIENEPNTIHLLLGYQFKYSMAALIVSAVCMGIGGWLAYSGVIGKTAFTAQVLNDFGLKVQMTDAGPGVVLFVVALIGIFVTRFNVRVDKQNQ